VTQAANTFVIINSKYNNSKTVNPLVRSKSDQMVITAVPANLFNSRPFERVDLSEFRSACRSVSDVNRSRESEMSEMSRESSPKVEGSNVSVTELGGDENRNGLNAGATSVGDKVFTKVKHQSSGDWLMV